MLTPALRWGMTRGSLPLVLLAVAACSGNGAPADRSAEAARLCESEVAKRLGTDAGAVTFDSEASRFGSGAWTVKGTAARGAAAPVPFTCGVYADGDRDDGPLRADGVRVPAGPEQ